VGFIQLLGPAKAQSGGQNGDGADDSGKGSRVIRQLEKSWPIGEQLKNNQADDLFAWIGRRIAEVVKDGCAAWPGKLPEAIPLGVTFSFPMKSVLPFPFGYLLTMSQSTYIIRCHTHVYGQGICHYS
jgi:hexokinase